MQRMLQGQQRIEAKIVTGFEATAAGQEQTRNALMKMFAGATNRRLFPALWTLETESHKLTKTMTLRMRILSDLSGVCYHEPLCITVGDATVAKYGGYIQKHVERATLVHNRVGGLDLPSRDSVDMSQTHSQTLSPDAALALFVDLLRIVCSERGREFDPLQMSELSGLECGYMPATGDYVWAHRDELLNRSVDIQLAHKSSADVAIPNAVLPVDTKTPAQASGAGIGIDLADSPAQVSSGVELSVLPPLQPASSSVQNAIPTTLGEGSEDLSPMFMNGQFKPDKSNLKREIRLIWKGALAGVMTATFE
ncbi:hypothetical protein P43SY_010748 [Pythium insidiosum]|uniref:Uncharacterized protein n=1 Tax=Pythium insidiosum TaxID=114742 RepID=A0AAD5Q4V4_PYTIN|nr:hypothetical protein P43SY_010748 [Pythium insidiosum]